jgi:L-fucose isomerase-like protein
MASPDGPGTAPLRIGLVAVIRPLFKGDSPAVAERAVALLGDLGEELGYELVTPSLPGQPLHPASGRELPGFAVHDEASASVAAVRLAELEPDLVLVQQTTFATGDLLAPLLKLPMPLALWAVPELSGGRGASGPLPLNSLCGLNMSMSLLETAQIGRDHPVKWLHGEADSAVFRRRFAPTVAALRALRALRTARILQIGGTAPHFYALEEMPSLEGVTVEQMPLEPLFERMAAVPRRQSRELSARWRAREKSNVDDSQLGRSAALELALAELVDEGGYSAVALRCWPELPERCGTMACAALARMGDRRIPAACEGDVMGALSMLALQGAGGSTALLMDLSDVDEEELFFWHCGNGPLEWAGPSGTRLSAHFNQDFGTVRDMIVRAGPATGFRLLDGGRRAVVFAGEFAGDRDGANYDGIRGRLGKLSWNGVPVTSRQFLANVLDWRLPHHLALGGGGLDESLLELCGWLGADPVPLAPERNTL